MGHQLFAYSQPLMPTTVLIQVGVFVEKNQASLCHTAAMAIASGRVEQKDQGRTECSNREV